MFGKKKDKMPGNCSAQGCTKPANLKFPSNPSLRQAWRVAVNRQGKKKGSLWLPTKYSCLCHDHFRPEDYHQPDITVPGHERKHLKAGAVPSLKLGKPRSEAEVTSGSETPRAKRMKQREVRGDIKLDLGRIQEDHEDLSLELEQQEVDQSQVEKNLPILHADMNWIGAEQDIVELPGKLNEDLSVTTKPPKEATKAPAAENDKNKWTQTSTVSTKTVGTETLKYVPRLRCKMSIEMFSTDEVALLFYTGFQNSSHFNFFFSCLEPAIYRLNYKSMSLSRKDELFLTLIKLRCGKPDIELSIMFGISSMVVSLIFNTMIRFLFYHLKDMTPWLPKDVVDMYTPLDFKSKYPGTRVILDGTEFHIQKPADVKDQSATWSSYKNHSTVKAMIGISPRGVVTHVSPTYGGCTSDRQIIERSELVQKGMFEKGDSIMADRGIMVQDMFASLDVKVNTPTMLRGRSQLSSEEVIKDRRIASKRIHVERVIGLAKTFKILANEMHHSLRPLSDKIVFVCFALCNFKPSIVGKYA